ncbi:MAG: hypothetical protein ACRCWY_10555 [Cellulosilyticaceae bacterium]
MNKEFWKSLLAVVGGYVLFTWLITDNWGTYKYMPLLVLIGSLGTFFFIGSLLHKKVNLVGTAIGIFLPHIIGDIIYIVGINQQSEACIKLFRQIVPHVYMSRSFLDFAQLQPSTKIIIMTLIIIPLSIGAVILGSKGREAVRTSGKWFFNNTLVWATHFFMFLVLTNLATKNPKIFSDQQAMMVFAILATLVIFIGYFFTGRACHTIKNVVGQVTSMISVTLTGLILYVGMLFVMVDAGIFERYILPVATSFIGIMCKELAIMTGATAKLISQYGFLATGIMLIVPVVLLCVGKFVSQSEAKLSTEGVEASSQEAK